MDAGRDEAGAPAVELDRAGGEGDVPGAVRAVRGDGQGAAEGGRSVSAGLKTRSMASPRRKKTCLLAGADGALEAEDAGVECFRSVEVGGVKGGLEDAEGRVGHRRASDLVDATAGRPPYRVKHTPRQGKRRLGSTRAADAPRR